MSEIVKPMAFRAGILVVALLGAGLRGVSAQPTVQDTVVPTDLTLGEAVDLALRQNREVRMAALALEEADKRVSEAWSNVYPSVDFSASYTRNISPAVNFLPAQIFDPTAGPDDFIPVRFGADNQWNTMITLEQPIFAASAFIGVGAAGRFRNLQEEVVRGQIQGVVTRVRVSYYQLLLAQEQRRLTDNSVRRVRESLEETRALNQAGLVSDYDVLRLEVELANLEPNLRRAENAVAMSRRQIAVDLGLEEGETLIVRGSLAAMDLGDVGANTDDNREILEFVGYRSAVVDEVEHAVATARELRSDLRQLEFTESLRETEMKLEKAEYFPRVTLFGDYTINAQENGSPDFFGESAMQRAYSKRLGIRVSVPIFQGFRRNARIGQKRAAMRYAETQTRLASAQAENQVKGLLDQLDEARMRAGGQRRAVGQAQRGFEIARAQFREGLGSQLELTDAEVALRQSEFNYAQAVFDFLVAQAQLDQATGRVPGVDDRLSR
ncbi:MAG: TolC family protein [Gemmatimonadota bacterium]|nr:TolC family protein [Gemmatimonadota bacterium]MDH5758785.1 TolC family protein [Gemmatimonadota bacterium]